MIRNTALLILAAFVLFACNRNPKSTGPITPEDIKSHIAVLANDSLMGRKPFTEGEVKTTRYISKQFKQIGLEPGNNGSYFQEVPMVEIKGSPSETMDITGGKSPITLHAATDFVAFSQQELGQIDLKNSPLVFAGYGVVAPEYHWND
jgi:hypothetical protein